MLSLVTVSPVITAFHSCCLLHHVFWPSKPLAGLGRNWNRYLLTMLTWNRRDSTPPSAALQAPKGDQGWIFCSYKSNYLFSLSGKIIGFIRPKNPTLIALRGLWHSRWRRWVSTVPGEHCQKIVVSIPTQAGQRFTWSKNVVR